MTIGVKNISIPVSYEVSEYEDSRFKKVKIWIAHTGENLNHSVFTKDSLEKMSDTLGYVPIVGYIEKSEDEIEDFSNHRELIKIKNGDVEYEYQGHAYGFIPENHNATFENRDGKEWLTAEGYLWTKFQKAMGIFTDSNCEKSQSMEISDIGGYIDDDGILNIESAVFTALCILGDDVRPAMSGSTIEAFSENKNIKEEIQSMIYEFSKKGDPELKKDEELKGKDSAVKETSKDVVDTKKEVVEDKVAKKDETKDKEKVKKSEKNETKEDKKYKVKTETKVDEKVEDKVKKSEKSKKDEEEKDDEKDKKFELVFELSHDDIRRSLYKAIETDDEDEYSYVVEVYDDYFVYQNNYYKDNTYGTKYIKAEYKASDDGVVLGKTEQVYPKFLTKAESDKVESDRAHLKDLENELTELKTYKAKYQAEANTAVLESYADKLDKKEYEVLLENVSNFTAPELEKEIAYSIFKASKTDDTVASVGSFSMDSEKEKGKYGSLDRLFSK